MILAVSLPCMLLSSCSNDDDDKDANMLVGTWEFSESKFVQIVNVPAKLCGLLDKISPDSLLTLIENPSSLDADYSQADYRDDPTCQQGLPYVNNSHFVEDKGYYVFHNNGKVDYVNPYYSDAFYYQQKNNRILLYLMKEDLGSDRYVNSLDYSQNELKESNYTILGVPTATYHNGVLVEMANYAYVVKYNLFYRKK